MSSVLDNSDGTGESATRGDGPGLLETSLLELRLADGSRCLEELRFVSLCSI